MQDVRHVEGLYPDDIELHLPVRIGIGRADRPETRRNQERFRILGVPTVILYEPDGHTELARFTSYLDAEALRPILVAAGRRDGGEAVRELVAARNAELQRRFAASQSVAR